MRRVLQGFSIALLTLVPLLPGEAFANDRGGHGRGYHGSGHRSSHHGYRDHGGRSPQHHFRDRRHFGHFRRPHVNRWHRPGWHWYGPGWGWRSGRGW
jgi:hypothetical protein